MKNRHLWIGALAALGVATTASFAGASSHREAPAISMDPAVDNTDVWAWVSPGAHDKLYVVAAYNPLEEPAGGPNFNKFADDALYEIHITRGNSSLDDVVTYQIKFSTAPYVYTKSEGKTPVPGGGSEFFSQIAGGAQTYSVTKIEAGKAAVEIAKDVKVAPPNIGPLTDQTAYGLTGAATDPTKQYNPAKYGESFVTAMGTEGRVFAGPRDDGFYVDLAGIFDLANLQSAGKAKDNVAGYNCHAIALEIPTKLLTGTGANPVAGVASDATKNDPQTLGVWASASRRKVRVLRSNGAENGYGPWVQVSRQGLPLVNEALIGLQDKDKYNRTRPKDDVANFGMYFLSPTLVRDAHFRGLLTDTQFDAAKDGRTDILDIINLKTAGAVSPGNHAIPLTSTGDVLRVDMGFDSGFPNGRVIGGVAGKPREEADVTDILLSVILLKTAGGISDNVSQNDVDYLTTFPFLAGPWQGFSQGHGK